MRIISKFKDYYDCIQSYGQDSSIVYVRNTKKIENKSFFNMRFDGANSDSKQHTPFLITSCIIGFCGKVYPVLKVARSDQYDFYKDTKWSFCFSIEDYDDYIIKNTPEEHLKNYYSSKFTWDKDWNWGRQKRRFAEKFFLQKGEREEVFITHESPIIVDVQYGTIKSFDPNNGGYIETNKHVEVNACLKKFEFYRIMDPHMAYQELSAFVGGVLGLHARSGKPKYKGKPMDMNVSDKDLAAAKGYDKWSFRQEPQPKPKKKRKQK